MLTEFTEDIEPCINVKYCIRNHNHSCLTGYKKKNNIIMMNHVGFLDHNPKRNFEKCRN